MKKVEVTYYCDFCKQLIDTDSDTVRAVLPGRIGYQDSFLADSEEEIRHYHDYCLEHLLTLEYQEEEPEEEPVKEEPIREEPTETRKRIDHDKIVALYKANPPRTVTWIADDIGCSIQTVINHLKKEGIYK